MWSVHAVECYSVKKNEVLIQAAVWMRLETVTKGARQKGPLL